MKQIEELSADERLEIHRLARQDECLHQGHRFTYHLAVECLAPMTVVCSRCGARWRIHPDDAQQNFGQQS